MSVHSILVRQLKRVGVGDGALPADPDAWGSLLEAISNAYEQADQDRYLLERSLSLSSEEMSELHRELAAERDTISAVICALGEGVCAVDAAGRVLFINPEARRLLALHDHAKVEGETLTDLVEASTADGATLGMLLACVSSADAEGSTSEPRLLVRGDEETFVTYSVAPLSEQREGTVLTLRDVSGRKRMEREREELNRRLMQVSRQAGMAEVASDVLHNVGNVLNSINVSCSMAIETARASRCTGVTRVATLLDEHRDGLVEFLTVDPAGVKIPEYLTQLGAQLARERDRLVSELEAVSKSTDHIREIVRTQQSLAKVAGIREMENVLTLIDEALRVTEPSLKRHGVRVVREFTPVEPVCVERHQVLQILINLISNAKQAVAGLPDDRRSVTIRTASRSGRVVVEVIDPGCGIPAENLTRIFSHGFTTRRDGHGFGLHSAALAAKAMGGILSVRSEGEGRGAAFTLDLPAGKSQKARVA